jgi:hypothetical protein
MVIEYSMYLKSLDRKVDDLLTKNLPFGKKVRCPVCGCVYVVGVVGCDC